MRYRCSNQLFNQQPQKLSNSRIHKRKADQQEPKIMKTKQPQFCNNDSKDCLKQRFANNPKTNQLQQGQENINVISCEGRVNSHLNQISTQSIKQRSASEQGQSQDEPPRAQDESGRKKIYNNQLYLSCLKNIISTCKAQSRQLLMMLENFQKNKQLEFVIIVAKGVQFISRINFKGKKEKQQFLLFLKKTDQEFIIVNPPQQSKIIHIEQSAFSQLLMELQEENNEVSYQQSSQFLLEQNPLEVLNNAIISLKAGSILAFKNFWKNGLFELISNCLKNWEIYTFQMEKSLIIFTRLIQYKIKRFTYGQVCVFSLLYPKIEQLHDKMIKFFNLPLMPQKLDNIKQQICKKMKISSEKNSKVIDKIIDFIFSRENSRVNEELVLSAEWNEKRKKISKTLSQKIKNKKTLDQCSQILTALLSSNKLKNEQYQDVKYFSEKEFQHFLKDGLIDTKCLGCSPFFIDKFNIWDFTVNSVPFKVFKSVRYMKEMENSIKHEICLMLNSGGGVILFDGQQNTNSVYIKGTLLTERNKELLEQRFSSYFQVFEPSIQAKKSFKITFVPIVRSQNIGGKENKINETSNHEKNSKESSSIFKSNELDLGMNYIKGCFAMRIVIIPPSSSTIFFWKENNNKQLQKRYENYICYRREDQTQKEIKMKNIRKQIKRKIKQHYISHQLTAEERKLLRKPANYFGHVCREPNPGIQMAILEKDSQKKQDQQEENFYSNASLVVVKQTSLEHVQKLFEQKGVKCKLEVKFKKQNLRTAKHTAIMYHDKPFSEIKAIKQTNKFEIYGKPLIIISITPYLMFKNNDNPKYYYIELFNKVSRWIEQLFPQQTLKLHQYTHGPQGIEYFIRTQSQQSILLAYYILGDYEEKVLMKNPQDYDKMDEDLKKKYFIQLCRKEGKKEKYQGIFEES